MNKINNVVAYMRIKNKDITDTKLMVLLWLANRMHINVYGRFIVDNDIIINEKGISFDYDIIEKIDYDYFSESDIEMMDFVSEEFALFADDEMGILIKQLPEYKDFVITKKFNINTVFMNHNIVQLPHDKNDSKLTKQMHLDDVELTHIINSEFNIKK